MATQCWRHVFHPLFRDSSWTQNNLWIWLWQRWSCRRELRRPRNQTFKTMQLEKLVERRRLARLLESAQSFMDSLCKYDHRFLLVTLRVFRQAAGVLRNVRLVNVAEKWFRDGWRTIIFCLILHTAAASENWENVIRRLTGLLLPSSSAFLDFLPLCVPRGQRSRFLQFFRALEPRESSACEKPFISNYWTDLIFSPIFGFFLEVFLGGGYWIIANSG